MSKHNKVNKSNYDQAGRLTPDELAREYKKQAAAASHAERKERISGKADSPAPGGNPPRNESEQ